MDQKNLDKELFQWKQARLEDGKFPCKCGHFESTHTKRFCIACHGDDQNHVANVHGEGFPFDSCFHVYIKMDNLSVIEWIAKNKEELQ